MRRLIATFSGTPWVPPVILLSAAKHENGAALLDAFAAHRAYIEQPSLRDALRKSRAAREILSRAEHLFRSRAAEKLENGAFDELTVAYLNGAISLNDAAEDVLKNE